MDAIDALLGRNSASRLLAPAPEGAIRDTIFRAALRAPDHGGLRPWRFLIVEGVARDRLGDALANAWSRHRAQATPEELAKLRAAPLRAPLVIVLSACVTALAKVPEIEQKLSVACAVQNMQIAAHALGFGSIWRSGAVTYTAELKLELGLPEDQHLLGFLYLGSVAGPSKPISEPECEKYFQAWGT